MNIGLLAMCVRSLLPVGLMQTWASVTHGYWYARSTEFLSTPIMQTLRWMRVPGDTIFAVGELVIVLFLFGLSTGHSFRPGPLPGPIASGRSRRRHESRSHLVKFGRDVLRLEKPATERSARDRSRTERSCCERMFSQQENER